MASRAMDEVFHIHQFVRSQNDLTMVSWIGGLDAKLTVAAHKMHAFE
jgi:hypothetical protein